MRILAGLSIAAALFAMPDSLVEQAPPSAAARTNPYEGQERAVLTGRKLYLKICAACHGKQGEGIGKRPALAVKAVTDAPAGALEWVVRNGSMHGMPSFSSLPEPQRWQIVTYVKTLK